MIIRKRPRPSFSSGAGKNKKPASDFLTDHEK